MITTRLSGLVQAGGDRGAGGVCDCALLLIVVVAVVFGLGAELLGGCGGDRASSSGGTGW